MNQNDALGSLRRNASSAFSFHDDAMDIFSGSSCVHEDDEEALKWAAIERLPTFDRLRKGLLAGPGSLKEVYVQELGVETRKELLERLVKVVEQDNENFLMKLKNRVDRVGITLPTIEVRFEGINVETEVHVGKRALPSFKNFYINIWEGFATRLHIISNQKKHLPILQDVSGIFKPGRVGITLPTIEVRFEGINVETEVHVGKRALPSFKNFYINIWEGFATRLHIISNQKKHLPILQDVSGILKPGRMALLLGPPSSGKTTLLLALAGKLDPSLKFSGSVTYNGHTMKEFVPQRTAAYISQHDVHVGEMTVRETLAFAARCQGVGSSIEMLAELSRREKEANIKPDPDIDMYMKMAAMEGKEDSVITDYIIKLLGLEVCADTMVGDGMIRGVSGGQRKRVTTGEMLVGPAKVLFMDEISTGLDSSTTYQVVNSIKQSVHILSGTAVISLLQPEPETYNLFDDIILISEGQIVYQGPRENVLDFFQYMGFKCPERKGVADFLQEVTSKKDQEQYWMHIDKSYQYVTVSEFAEGFKSYKGGQKLISELATTFDKSKSHPAALTTEKYGAGKMKLLRACADRELLLMKRNSFFYAFRTFRLTVMGLIAMTLFFRTQMHHNLKDGNVLIGALYYSISTIFFGGIGETTLTVQKLPILYKQRDFFFYPAWAYGIPSWIYKIPTHIIEVAAYMTLTYYVIGFDPNVGRMFKQYLVFIALMQTTSAIFRFVGAVSRNIIIAITWVFLILLLSFCLGGFVLSKENIRKWWIWGYYLSPMMYAQNAAVVNEFTGHSWSHVSSSLGLKHPANTNVSLGVQVLKSRGFFTQPYWYWIGLGALLAMVLVFNLCYILAITFHGPLRKSPVILSADPLSEDTKRNNQHKYNDMVLPFEPHWITFSDIKYSVDMPKEMKGYSLMEDRLMLLKGVSGAFMPGVLTALMGVSGAGKTTLMDVLAGRKTGGYIEGNISISGYPKKQETFTRISGYCEQNDIHSPNITIYESLLFSAWLRLPTEVDSNTRKLFVEKVMELIELTSLREAIVGIPNMSGLSAEQRKRLTIAVELVANPSIIFMDEPTSGLDARAAAIVMRAVRNIVSMGRTVLCTIHQPSIDIFESFDELFLMRRGGQEIYVGPLGHHSLHLIQYFEEIQGVTKIKDGCNPAKWMLEATSSAQEHIMGIDFAETYRNSELYRRNRALIDELSKPRLGTKELHFTTQYSQPLITQCLACLWKQHWSYWRNPLYTAVKVAYTAFLAIVVGSLFWDLGSKTETKGDILNAMGSMYASVLMLGIQCSTAVQPIVATERMVAYRERAAGMYAALPFAFGQIVVEIPYLFAQTLIYGPIVYAMIGFEWTATKFMLYMFFMFFSLLDFSFFGMMVVALMPSQQHSSIIATAMYSIWSLFSGFIIPRPRTPVWWRWYHWACPLSWTLYGLISSQFGDVKGLIEDDLSVEKFVRSYFGFRHDFIGVAAVMMIVFGFVFAGAFSISIKVLNFQRR